MDITRLDNLLFLALPVSGFKKHHSHSHHPPGYPSDILQLICDTGRLYLPSLLSESLSSGEVLTALVWLLEYLFLQMGAFLHRILPSLPRLRWKRRVAQFSFKPAMLPR